MATCHRDASAALNIILPRGDARRLMMAIASRDADICFDDAHAVAPNI